MPRGILWSLLFFFAILLFMCSELLFIFLHVSLYCMLFHRYKCILNKKLNPNSFQLSNMSKTSKTNLMHYASAKVIWVYCILSKQLCTHSHFNFSKTAMTTYCLVYSVYTYDSRFSFRFYNKLIKPQACILAKLLGGAENTYYSMHYMYIDLFLNTFT